MLSRKKEFYVYVLLDPRKPGAYKFGKWKFSYEPFYVGKGKRIRYAAHLEPNARKAKSYKAHKIAKILRAGYSEIPLRIVKQNLTEKQAFSFETNLIAVIGRGGKGPLTNGSDGGEGSSGHNTLKSAETRRRMSEYQKNRPKEHTEKIAAANRGKIVSLETRAKISEANKGKCLGRITVNAIEIQVGARHFKSMGRAAKALKLPVSTVHYRVNSKSYPSYSYV